jgi:hypothetical protein
VSAADDQPGRHEETGAEHAIHELHHASRFERRKREQSRKAVMN